MVVILRLLITLVICCGYQNTTYAQDSADQLLEKALWEYRMPGSSGSVFERRLEAIIRQDPTHPGALWQLVFRRYHLHQGLNGKRIDSQPETLAAAGPAVRQLVNYARERGDDAFGYYMLARYSSLYHVFDKALASIDQALLKQPDSPRYLRTKGKILIRKGQWEKDDTIVLEGMRQLENVLRLIDNSPTVYVNPADIYFELAYANTVAHQPAKKTIEYYISRLEYDGEKTSLATTWSNLSEVYRKQGDCIKAQEAAKNSLKLHKFKHAKANLRYAQICQEMSSMGALANVKLE